MFSHFLSMATRLSKLFSQYEAEITWIAMTKVPPFSLHNMKTFIKLRDSFVRIVFLSLYSEGFWGFGVLGFWRLGMTSGRSGSCRIAAAYRLGIFREERHVGNFTSRANVLYAFL